MLLGRDLPQLLQPDAELLRLAVSCEIEFRDDQLGERAARALREQRVLGAQLHAARERVLVLAVLPDAHVAGRDADDFAALAIEHFGGREARIDLDAEPFRLRREPAAHIAERHDEVAVVRHQRRHHEIRQAQAARRPEPVEAVVGHRRLDRRVFAAPFGQQPVEPDRIDHRAGEDMRADLGALLHHDHGELGVELLQPDRGRQAPPARRRRSRRRTPSPRGRADRCRSWSPRQAEAAA